MKVFSNIAGTMADSFRISKTGPTIHTGLNSPASALGAPGDIFIMMGDTPRIMIKNEAGWDRIVTEDQSLFRTKVTTNSFAATNDQYYLGISAVGSVIINLPSGQQNKKFVIKDETGLENRSILIVPAASQTIDGRPSFELSVPYSSINIIYGDEWHVY